MEIVLEAGHTHFYPGHEGWVEGEEPSAPPGAAGLPSRILFAGGAIAGGSLSREDGGSWVLEVDPYTTAAGTTIAARRWQIAFRRAEGGRARFRIERKLAARTG